jgi:hypothetical protein
MQMYRRNDTQAFMDAMLDDIDHVFLMREARAMDASKLEKKQREAQVEFDQNVAKTIRIARKNENARIASSWIDSERSSLKHLTKRSTN